MKLDIIEACSDLGVHINGASLGPEKLINNLNLHPKSIVKSPNIVKDFDTNNKYKNLKYINEFNVNLYNLVSNSLNQDNFPLTIAGDHSTAIPTALASIKKYNNLGIIWFDAHGDFNTFSTTLTGNIHGLPLAAITNYEKEHLSNFHSGNYYNFNNTVIVGVRDLDPFEKANLLDAGITMFTTQDIKTFGFEKIYNEAFKIASTNTNRYPYKL